MRYDQILSKARTVCGCQNDDRCMEVRISGSPEQTAALFEQLGDGMRTSGLDGRVIRTGSFGYYDLEPVISIRKPGRPTLLYGKAAPETVSALLDDYPARGGTTPDGVLCSSDLPLFRAQRRIALRNCGLIDPEAIDHYIAVGRGYSGLSRVLATDRAEVIEALRNSGLDSAAGCRAADKLQALGEAGGDEKFVTCNALDANPGGRTARLLLEGDPHGVFEGMLIAAYAVGAGRCIIVADSRRTTGIRRITKALEEMKDSGLAGGDILGAGFSCEVEIREATPSLTMGEETALLRLLEGKQAMPDFRPMDSGVLLLSGRPCLVDDIETFAKISAVFQDAPEWRAGPEAEKRRGTRVLTLTGDVGHAYTVEVPVETTIRTLVAGIGGGVATGGRLKAVQFGGPTGSLLGPDSLDLPIGAVAEAGPDTGSATIEVFDARRCAVEIAEERMAYLQTQSCGKCVFCREGTFQMSDILRSVAAGEGTARDLDLLSELGEAMRTGCVCAIGAAAANPVLSGIKLFREEYEEHIRGKICKSGSRRSSHQV